MRNVVLLTILLLLPSLSGTTFGALMAIWDFGPNASGYTEAVTTENVIGVPTLVLDGGEIDGNGKDGTSYVDVAGILHSGGQAGAWEDVRVAGGKDAEWIMTINTTNWENITIRWDYKAWDPNTSTFDLDFRIGSSGIWSVILNNRSITADGTYHSFSYDLSGIAVIENQPIVEFRFYDLDRYGNGKFAFDNLELSGVPEPCTIFLLSLGGVAVLRKRKNPRY